MNTIVQIDGAVIRKLCEEQGLTQLYIATAVGVTVDTISRWENKRYPGIKQDNGLKLALALGVELEDISRQSDNAAVEETERIHPGTVPEATSKGRNWQWLPLNFGVGGVFLWRSTHPHITLTASRVLPPHSAPGHPFPVAVMISGNADLNTPLLIREHRSGSSLAGDACDRINIRVNRQHGSDACMTGQLFLCIWSIRTKFSLVILCLLQEAARFPAVMG